MSLTGFEVYKFYLSTRLHFTSHKYNVIKSNGKTSVKHETFLKRRDATLFEQLAKKFEQPRDVIRYLVANFAYGHDNVMYDREKGQELVTRWIKNKESMSRVFRRDLDTIRDHAATNRLNLAIVIEPCALASNAVIKLMRADRVNIESAVILCQLTPGLLEAWESITENSMIYSADLLRIRKLHSFVIPTELCLKALEEFESELDYEQN